MLTSYWVSCPHTTCHWSGDLLPREDRTVQAPAVPAKRLVRFVCPGCRGEFHGRVQGDDVVPLPLPQAELAAK